MNYPMTLKTRILILNALCVTSLALSVVTTFIRPDVADLFGGLGLGSGSISLLLHKKMSEAARQNGIPPPRLVSNSLARKLTWGWLLIYAPVTVCMVLLGTARLLDWELFKTRSVETSGFVTGKDKSDTGVSPYRLAYHYYAGDGKRYDCQVGVDSETWASLNEGDSVSIKYLPHRPWRSLLDIGMREQQEGGAAIIEIGVGVIIFALGTWAFVCSLKKYQDPQPRTN